jgi:hypothetical protein
MTGCHFTCKKALKMTDFREKKAQNGREKGADY